MAIWLATSADPGLPRLNVHPEITLSGVSSGAAFAIQYHVAHSAHVVGAGLFAGPPFYCAQANVDIALSACMEEPELIVVEELIAATAYAADLDSIDKPSHLDGSKVWIFSGTKDTVVHQGVVDKTNQYYDHYISNKDIVYVNNVGAEHSWVTDSFGRECSYLGDPYINNCNLDETGNMLSHVLNMKLSNRTATKDSNLLRFDQKVYVPLDDPAAISMAPSGYLYVPTGCQGRNSSQPCHLHVAFHGCNQDLATIGTTFVTKTGLNEYAEANNIVVLYPQAQRSPEIPYNPKGCWDWWGYTGLDYATQLAPQIIAVRKMVTAISGEE